MHLGVLRPADRFMVLMICSGDRGAHAGRCQDRKQVSKQTEVERRVTRVPLQGRRGGPAAALTLHRSKQPGRAKGLEGQGAWEPTGRGGRGRGEPVPAPTPPLRPSTNASGQQTTNDRQSGRAGAP